MRKSELKNVYAYINKTAFNNKTDQLINWLNLEIGVPVNRFNAVFYGNDTISKKDLAQDTHNLLHEVYMQACDCNANAFRKWLMLARVSKETIAEEVYKIAGVNITQSSLAYEKFVLYNKYSKADADSTRQIIKCDKRRDLIQMDNGRTTTLEELVNAVENDMVKISNPSYIKHWF